MSAPRSLRAVVIDPAYLGDAVFCGPIFRALKAADPSSHLGFVVRPPADALARRIEGVDRIHRYDKRGSDRGWAGLRKVAQELEEEGYERALIPHPSPRSALLARLARIPARVGTATGLARWVLTEQRPSPPKDTLVQSRLRVLDGGPSGASDQLAGCVRSESKPVPGRVGLVLGSQWQTKRWAHAQAARFVEAAQHEGMELVFLGAEFERPLYQGLAANGAIDLLGSSIEQMVDQLAACSAVVGGDTGPIQIARGLGVPVVALFGPTSPLKHRFSERDAPLSTGIDCSPCSAHGHRTCPLQHHRCMVELDAEMVVQAVRAILAAEKPSGF